MSSFGPKRKARVIKTEDDDAETGDSAASTGAAVNGTLPCFRRMTYADSGPRLTMIM
jgi:hypothetical protein